MSQSVKLLLQRSFSDHLKYSKCKALDLINRSARERRFAGGRSGDEETCPNNAGKRLSECCVLERRRITASVEIATRVSASSHAARALFAAWKIVADSIARASNEILQLF
ncbi:hypothetical protein SKAU_G00039100 [Synaphobranchus kaupii]|uniref:Uncharacterized protein n=1 Tax=Synaphobranchus kaupii TaxID=118154 RepID=A0A9Q1GI02_SYNKA|nr:hypothetical protein SKAU_G00039100 [Synaphobranchus kaupii]